MIVKKQITFKEWKEKIYQPPNEHQIEWDEIPLDAKYILKDMVDEYNQFISKNINN